MFRSGKSALLGPLWVTLSFGTALGVVGFIGFFLLIGSLPVLHTRFSEFFLGLTWHPDTQFGALPILYNTLLVGVIAMAISVPISLAMAVGISEFIPRFAQKWVKTALEILNGIPGVVYGLIGLTLLSPRIKTVFNLLDGNTIFAAGFLLALMVTPTMTTLMEEGLQAVSRSEREQGLALGFFPAEVMMYVVIPRALPTLVGAVLLGFSRALGETIAVMLVIGSIDRLPSPLWNIFSAGQTIASKIGREAAESVGIPLHWSALCTLGLLLFGIVFVVTCIGDVLILRQRSRRW